MAKSLKQQIASSIASSQYDQAMRSVDPEYDAKKALQNELNNWYEQQQLQAEYDKWAKKNLKKGGSSSSGSSSKSESQNVEPMTFMTAEERQQYKKDIQRTVENRRPYATYKQSQKVKEGAKSLTDAYQKYLQDPDKIESMTPAKREKKSSVSEQQSQSEQKQTQKKQTNTFTDRTLRGNRLDEYALSDLALAEKKAAEERAYKERQENNPLVENLKGSSSNQPVVGGNYSATTDLSMPQYAISEKERPSKSTSFGVNQITLLGNYIDKLSVEKQSQDLYDQFDHMDLANMWLDPEYKLSKAEEKQAKTIINDELKQLRGKKLADMTPEERERLDTFQALKTKISNFQSLAIGAGKAVLKAGQGLGDLILNAGQANAPTSGALDIQRKNLENYRNKVNETNESIADTVENAKTQNPLAYGGGQFAGNAAMYMATNPLFDSVAGLAGAGMLGRYALNQVGQAGQDLALDIYPTLVEMRADGEITDAEYKELVDMFSKDVAANVLMDVGGNAVSDLLGKVSARLAAKSAAKNAINSNSGRELPTLLQNADTAAKASDIPGLNTAEDVTNDINKQFSDAMKQYNGQFKDTSAMRNVYNADDLERSLNKQLSEALQNNGIEPARKSMNKLPNRYPEGKIYITDDNDISDYLKSGSRGNKNRLKAYNEGKKISIGNRDELAEFLYGDNSNYADTVTFGKVSDRLAEEIENASRGKFDDLYGAYLDVEKGHSGHSIDNHSVPKEPGDLPLSKDELLDAFENTNNAKVLEAKEYPSGDRTVKLALPTDNGHVIMIETVSKSRGSLIYRNGWIIDNQKFIDNYLRSNPNSAGNNSSATVRDGITPYTKNISDAVEGVNKNTVNTSENVLTPEEINELNAEYSNMWAPDAAKTTDSVMESAAKTQRNVDLPTDVQDKMISDFEEIYNSMDSMYDAAQKSGNADAIAKYSKLQNAVEDYENKLWRSEDIDEVEKAKKAADAARQSFIREMKKANPNYKAELTGTKLGNAIYRRTSQKIAEKESEELANSFIASENYLKAARNNPEGANPMQFFAEGDAPKEQWKTSKWRTNTAEKTGAIQNPDDIPLKDYGYRVFHELEQHEAAKARYADSNDITSDLLFTNQFDEVDMKAAMDEWLNLMEDGSPEALRKARRLGTKISHEGREGARTVQALAEYGRSTPEGQLRFAQDAIDDIVDKKTGTGTSDALHNLTEKIYKAFDNANGDKDAFMKEVEKLLDGNVREHASADTAKKMVSKKIQGKDKIMKMIKKGANIDDVVDQVYKENGGVRLTIDEQKKIYDYLVAAQKEAEGSYAQEVLLSKAAKLAVGRAPSTLGQKIRSVLYTNMLGNFKTALSRNAFGNLAHQTLEQGRQPIAAAVDWATSKVTGKHSALGWNAGKAKAYAQGFGQGTVEQVKDIAKHVDTGRSGAKGWEEALRNNATTFNDSKLSGKLANSVEFYVRNAMELGDRPFYEANYRQAYTELEQLLDRYGKDGVAGLEGIKDKDLPEMMDMIASVRAADAVFQKHGKMSKGLTDIRNGLGQMSEGVVGADVLSTAASPFTMTPGNMIEKAIEYTPLGFLKNGVETAREVFGKQGFNQRRFVDEASRSIMGLPVLGAAYYGAKKGLINGGYSTDPDEKQAQIDDGFIEYGLNVPEWVPYYGGKTLDTSDLPEYGPFMQAGAVMAEEGISPGSSLQAAEAILGGSTTQGLRRVFGADSAGYSSNNRIVDNIANTVLSSGSQLIPSLARQTAQTMDPYKRDLGEYGTTEYYLNLMKNSDPIGRQTLPIKTDVEGNPILQNQGRSLPEKILENYFLPMNVSEYRPSELNQEASRLLEETGSAKGFQPKALRKDLRAWDEIAGQEYSEEQFRDYKESFGKMNAEVGTAVINSDLYKGLDAEAQNKMLSDVYSAMKAVAKYNMTGIETDDKIAKAYMDGDVTGMLRYLTTKSIADQYGVGSTSKVYQSIQAAVGRNDVAGAERIAEKESKYHEALDSLGLEGSTAARKAYDEGGTNGLKKLAQYKATLEKYGLENNADNRKFLDEYGEKGLKEKQIFDSYGSNSKDAYNRYNNAKTVISGLTPSQFKSTYDSIDKMGDSNGSVTQEEMKAYLNAGNYTQEQANQLWEAYGNAWKSTITKGKNGQWVTKRN